MSAIKAIIVPFLVASFGTLYACGGLGLPTSGGEISYSVDSTNPLQVNVTLTLYFDRNEALPADSVVLSWGDGNSSAIYAQEVDTDFYALANMPYSPLYRHVYAGSHAYAALPQGGYYFIGTTGEYHIAGIGNLNGGSGELFYYIRTMAGMDSSTQYYYTPPALQPVNLMFSGLSGFTDTVLTSVPKGDSVVFQLVPALQPDGTPIPNAILPSQVCSSADSSFAIDSHTGVITWNNICLQGIFDVTTLISTYRNGKLIGSIMRDQLLYTELNNTSAITEVATGQLKVYPNPANSLINITLPEDIEGEIGIYDMDGRQVLSIKVSSNIQQTLNISSISQGIYLLSYQNGNGRFLQKVVKQ